MKIAMYVLMALMLAALAYILFWVSWMWAGVIVAFSAATFSVAALRFQIYGKL